MERDKLLVEFDWTSEVDDIVAGGESWRRISRVYLLVVYNSWCYLCCAVGVSMVSSGGEEGNGSALHRRVIIEQAHGSSPRSLVERVEDSRLLWKSSANHRPPALALQIADP